MEALENKTCSKCKEVKPLSDFYMRSDRLRPCSHCIICLKRKYKENYLEPSFAKEKLNRSIEWQKQNPLKSRYLKCKSNALNANRRKIRVFSLSYEEMVNYWNMQCTYCSSSILEETGVGLDRLDNSEGYTKNNVVPCCGSCNYIKGTQLTSDEMKVAMKAVIEYRSIGKT